MDYKKQVFEMMQHLCADFSPDRMESLVVALAHGISKTLALIDSHDNMHAYLEGVLNGLAAQACIDHTNFHEQVLNEQPQRKMCDEERHMEDAEGVAVDYETFLRDFFQPTKPND